LFIIFSDVGRYIIQINRVLFENAAHEFLIKIERPTQKSKKYKKSQNKKVILENKTYAANAHQEDLANGQNVDDNRLI